MGQRYRENFATDPGGWWGWESNSAGPRALEHSPGALTSRSPWWIDYNHAPPGAGYLHMLFCTYTRGPIGEYHREVGGPHRLLEGGFPRDYTHARITLRLKGELHPQGTQLVFLAQATVGEITSCWSLTGQPLTVSPDWSEQTIICTPDPAQWTAMGTRHDRQDYYGVVELERVLGDVNCDIMLILFPLDVLPMGPLDGDRDLLRPEKDYPVWRWRLPEGYVTLDWIDIEFP
jgi:hypothetical protein